jgi:NAD(P)-dependent dehydrogenase (short-subunit alcohol dehydrogenase family)
MRLKDKIGTVTAAASGMGRAGALRFAKEGAAVGVVDIDKAGVEAVVAEIKAAGGRALPIVADLTRDEDSRRIVTETAKAFGGLDFVWNHVGHPGPASVEGIDMRDFDLAVTLNLRTVLITTEAALPEMRARGGGSLLYTASTSGLMGSPFSPVYSAVKHGVVGFVRALAKRHGREKIRANAICPGSVDTPMLRVFVARRPAVDARCRQGGAGAPARRAEPARTPGAAGGDRQRGAVPDLGRGLVRHRRRLCCRRRHHRIAPMRKGARREQVRA